MASTNTRLAKEYKLLQKSDMEGIVCTPKHDSLDQYEARIEGPRETPYESGLFLLDIVLTKQYPIEPPSVKFRTRIYHPNIDDHGNICLDLLKTGKNGTWNPQWTLESVLRALTLLMDTPNPDDPLMPDIADEMKCDVETYRRKAREWTAKYAKLTADDQDEVESELSQMPESVTKPATTMRSLGLKRKSASPNSTSTLAGPKKSKDSGGESARPPWSAPAASAIATGASSSASRRLGLSRSKNTSLGKSRASQSSAASGHVSAASSQEESQPLPSDRISSSSVGSLTSALRKASCGARLSDLLGRNGQQKKRNTRRSIPALHSSQTSAASDSQSDKPGAKSNPHSNKPSLAGEGSSTSKNRQQGALVSDHDESSPLAAQCLVEESDAEDEKFLELGSSTNPASLDFECLLSPGDDTSSLSVSIVPSSHADSEQEPAIPKASPAMAAAPTDSMTDDKVPVQRPALATLDRKGKGKGKAPDRRPQQQKQLEAAEVLDESHFGPLDLGLPPIRVSAQRGLMRRRHR
ncbi:hypothetical protein FBU59_001574 [Linderina macrospora]|uniref:Uncharacterized protein n=1 Tax=Linderina macrospora TaxID=4868 RepID=A0ACC1JDX2_9FUNG|nr:hypothetical protein FBU59_001574 [Linderina macrospora]